MVGRGHQTGTTVTELNKTEEINSHEILSQNKPKLHLLQLNARLLIPKTVIWKITTGESMNFKFRILTNPTCGSQWSHWTFYLICKRQFTPYLEWTKMSARTNLHFFIFRFTFCPFYTLRSLFYFSCASFSALLLFRVSRVWCGFFVCLVITFNNSFSLKNSPYSFLLFSLLFAFHFILLISPVMWSSCNIIDKLAVLSAQVHCV